jgi:predicted regulator of Ras-like GTPase activity (Roadblock/LC7/MglB family)
MTTEACISALKSTLVEIKNICPQVSNTFIFRKDRKILAQDESTDEKAISHAIDAFSALNERAKTTGGVEYVTFQGTKNQVIITRINSFYFAAVASREADEKTLRIITRALVPSVLKTVEKIQPALANPATEPAASNNGTDEKAGDNDNFETCTPAETSVANEPDPFFPEPPVSQCMVENLSGFGNLLGSQDIVRVDSTIIARWKNLYGEKRIEEVQVEETRTGKSMRCKFKPLKDQKLEGKGIIQIPEKAQLALQTKKGALVTVKPIIE